MSRFIFFALAITLMVLTNACKKDQFTVTTSMDDLPEPTSRINILAEGFVTDYTGEAIEDAVIRLDDKEVLTNALGYFRLKGDVAEVHGFLQVAKTGYYAQYPAFTPSENGKMLLRIQLKERSLSGTISSDQGGTVAATDGGQVRFQANGFKDVHGNPYSGQVHVFATYVDPTQPFLVQRMSGDLTALNAENERVALKSFGMLNVELEDDAGRPIQITENATLTVPVPSSLTGEAPSTIPLWYFDETIGLWIEEGSAQFDGTNYEGTVSHFTFWNCDVPFDFINLSGIVLRNALGPELKVCVEDLSNQQVRCTDTNLEGYFSGKVPANQNLKVTVYDNCGTTLYAEDIGSFVSDQVLSPISVDVDTTIFSTISGTLLDCDQRPVTEGMVFLEFEDNNQFFALPVQTDGSGTFESSILSCGAQQFNLTGLDLANGVQGPVLSFSTQSEIDVGAVSACAMGFSEFMSVELEDGFKYVINNCKLVEIRDTVGPNTIRQYIFKSWDQQDVNNTVIYGISFETIFIDGNEVPAWGRALASAGPIDFIGEPEPFFSSVCELQILAWPDELTNGEYVVFNQSCSEDGNTESGEITVTQWDGSYEHHTNCRIRFSARIEL